MHKFLVDALDLSKDEINKSICTEIYRLSAWSMWSNPSELLFPNFSTTQACISNALTYSFSPLCTLDSSDVAT